MNRIALTLVLAFSASVAFAQETGIKQRVYIGTYTGAKSKGIYLSEFDAETGKLSEPKLAAETVNPTFLALHPDGKHLYAVNEVGEFLGKKAGGVTSYAIDEKGGLTKLNEQHSGGPGPCHLVVDREGKCVLAANYGGGSCCAIMLNKDGSLGDVTSFFQHEAKAVPPGGKARPPRGHSINVSPDNKLVFCADLGRDEVVIYNLDAAAGKLTKHEPAAGHCPEGSGPRHFAFHPSGMFAYAINESSKTITVFAFDAAKGSLTELQTISTVPEGVTGGSTAEVVVHPSGKFVYGSNRGHDSIAVFQVDQATGKLTAAGHQGEGIKTPRNFNLDLTGKWLLVGSQSGNNVAVFKVDQASGSLTPTGNKIELAAPVCLKFLKQ